MNIKELKEKLKDFPDDAIIVVDGYEWGFEEPNTAELVDIELNVYSTSFGGPHEIIDEHKKMEKKVETIKGVYIGYDKYKKE